jgi:hypothetical protein
MRSEITQLESCFRAQALLDRAAPLLYVLRWRVGLERCKADSRRAQNSGTKVEVIGDDARCGNEIVTLLRLRKNLRHVVTLVTPRVHVNRSEEDTECSVSQTFIVEKEEALIANYWSTKRERPECHPTKVG